MPLPNGQKRITIIVGYKDWHRLSLEAAKSGKSLQQYTKEILVGAQTEIKTTKSNPFRKSIHDDSNGGLQRSK